MLRITEINEIKEAIELRDEWSKALESSRDNNIYLTLEYLSTYWKHFASAHPNNRLRVLCIEDGNKIVAVAPLRQSTQDFVGPFHYDVVTTLGARGSRGLEGADYTDFILAEREEEALNMFLKYLLEYDDWDFMYLIDVPETSPTTNILARISKTMSIKYDIEKGEICPYLPLPSSASALIGGISKNFRHSLRRRLRNLEKECPRVELKEYHELGSVEETMSIFFELHQKRWQSRNMTGVFATRVMRDFYTDVAKLFDRNRWLALYFLTADDQPIAAQYCYEYNRKMYFCLSGFDPDYSQYSVGNLILMKIMEKCIERGLEECDFMKGKEQYKFDWTGRYRTNLKIRIVNKKLSSNLHSLGMRIVKRIKMDKLFK